MGILQGIKKQDIAVITTNLTAVALAVFFMIAYKEKGLSVIPALASIVIALLSFIVFVFLVLTPIKGVRPLPSIGILAANVFFATCVSIYFFNRIGLDGAILTISLSFLLSLIEHILYESVRA